MGLQLEKYDNWIKFFIGYLYRFLIRWVISGLVQWPRKSDLQDGCSVIIGMCSKLPDVLPANLACLKVAKWSDLKEVVIAVDCTEDRLPAIFIQKICEDFKDLNIRFVFYSKKQSFVSEFLKLPYVYCWLSWCIAISKVKTKHFFIHDYDALLLDNVLSSRYKTFVDTKRIMQGVFWYCTNGIVPSDQLVSTFEAFVDTQWVRSCKPVEMFNQIGTMNGRRLDFDILLDMQIRYAKAEQRGMIAMSEEEMAHPAQMIHQYTVFRKFPGRPWNCAALLMIPFFYYLSGRMDALSTAFNRVNSSKDKVVELLGDGCVMNFSYLQLIDLETMLRLMIQVFVKLKIVPFNDFYRYAQAFYDLVQVPEEKRWQFDRNQGQKEWIARLLREFVAK